MMTSAEHNLSPTERAIYIAAGLGLAAVGAQPRPNPLLNVLALAGGAYLAWSGYQGHCAVRAALADSGVSLGQTSADQIAQQKAMTTPAGYA
jgi:threonine/homoserine/homoserine lactone efflux protein